MHRFGITLPSRCHLCDSHEEDFQHVFFSCPISYAILTVLDQRLECGWKVCIILHCHILSIFGGICPCIVDRRVDCILLDIVGSFVKG
jgi:hypothetical protein